MKHLSKLHIILFSLVALFLLSGVTVSAAQYEDTLRVGIYYGSSTVEKINFESPSGFLVGFSGGRELSQSVSVENTNVTVSKTAPGTHCVLYSSHETAEELSISLEGFKTNGVDVFPALYNNQFCAVGGTFKNYNDALWQAENSAVKGSPIALSENSLCLTDTSSGKTLFVSDNSNIALFSSDTENEDALIKISGSAGGSYRGGFECTILADGLTLVNIIPVESYLYSVVCREMSPSWPIEALKVQAVCARNFALGRINYHSKYGFDVCRTVCCQAYSNNADNSESVHTAVDETRGELLFYNETLVQAVYSSSMGSSTESVENVWGSKHPYLVSVENPYEDTENIYNGKWTKTLTKSRATEIMNSRGYNIGDVVEIKALEYSDAGRVLKLLVKGTNGEKIFERESCRTIFSEVTYSQKYTVAQGGLTTYPVVYVADGSSAKAKTLTTVSVLTGKNKTETASGSFVVSNGKTTKKYITQSTDAAPDTFVFSGEGWGHGVGMSQYGAKGMAENGFDYEDILTHYYTGTHLEQAY